MVEVQSFNGVTKRQLTKVLRANGVSPSFASLVCSGKRKITFARALDLANKGLPLDFWVGFEGFDE